MPNYVYSTATASTDYAVYDMKFVKQDPNALPMVTRTITIKGGHGLADKNFLTPRGVVTEVSDDDLEILEKDYHFNEGRKHGYITVERTRVEPSKVADSMSPRDGSAPITPDSMEPGDTKGTYKLKKGKR